MQVVKVCCMTTAQRKGITVGNRMSHVLIALTSVPASIITFVTTAHRHMNRPQLEIFGSDCGRSTIFVKCVVVGIDDQVAYQ